MTTIRNLMLSCVSDRAGSAPTQVVKFNSPLTEAFKYGLPTPIIDILVYIAREGVTTPGLFRRPGNTADQRVVMKRLVEGKPVILKEYNFYTLASVLKQFLLRIPGGILGREAETDLLATLNFNSKLEQYDQINSILTRLSQATQQLLALLFGTFFRVTNHAEFNTMSTEALAKSVAGSLFHTCAHSKEDVERASTLIRLLINDFGVPSLFGSRNISYFCHITNTYIHVKERFRYEERSTTPSPTVERSHQPLQAVNSVSAPEVSAACEEEKCGSLNRFNSVKRRQVARMRERRNWFEGTESTTTSFASSSSQAADSSDLLTHSSPPSPNRQNSQQYANRNIRVVLVERIYKPDSF